MTRPPSLKLFGSTILIVGLIALFSALPAFADDSPPPEATAEASPTPLPIETTEPTVTPGEPPAVDSLSVAEFLAAAPEDTQVIVLDESGEPLNLVSNEVASIVSESDPVWCPIIGGVPLQPGDAGCSANFATPEALITAMSTVPGSYTQPGIIYFTAASGGAFVLTVDTIGSQAVYDSLKQYNLTLQGGWNGLNSGSGFALSGQTDFGSYRIQIGTSSNTWLGNITINQLVLDGVADSGLTIYTGGNIAVNNVGSQNNEVSGATLRTRTGSVSVQSSTFDGNLSKGLDISAGGITLSDVNANFNGAAGADLYGSSFIFVSDSNFDSNTAGAGGTSAGLNIFSGGSVFLSGVSASNSLAGDGADIYGFSSVSIMGSTFSNNLSSAYQWGWGLYLMSLERASVTLSNVDASNNPNRSAGGVYILTSGNASAYCSRFNYNGGVGVDGTSVSGAFWLNDVVLDGNGRGPYAGSPSFTAGPCGGYLPPVDNGSSDASGNVAPLIHIVPVQGSEQVALDCTAFTATRLVLPNGDSVLLPCPLQDQGQLSGLQANDLPKPLPASYTLISALEINVIRDGQLLDPTRPAMTIDFVIPEGQTSPALTVLHWDGSQWIEFSGVQNNGGTHFTLTTGHTGIFALASE